jgi:peptide/nickel transport system permease protein
MKVLRVLLTVFLTVSLSFYVLSVLPADPARLLAGPQARPADVEALRAELGLNAPVPTRYRMFWKRLLHTQGADTKHGTCATLGPLHMDLGRSYRDRRSVVTLIGERFPHTLFLASVGIAFQLLFGIVLGALAARSRALDGWLMNLSFVGASVPTFVLGGALRYVFAERLQWLPLDGFGTTALEHFRSVVLPGLTLGLYGAAYYAKLSREELGEQLRKDYVRTARAKGASEGRALFVHALRNALLPIVTAAAMDFGALLGGAVVTETIFRWPGIGLLSVQSLLDRDGPVIMGLVIMSATFIVLFNLAADGLVRMLDPRSRAVR